jgi:hypothetical protein
MIQYIKDTIVNARNNREKLSILWLILLFILVLFISYTSQADYIEIINEKKKANIKIAEEQIKIKDEALQNLRLEESKLVNAISIYQECIKLNTTKDLPISCEDITIDIKWELNWLVNKNWQSQSYIDLIWDNPKARAEYLLSKYPIVSWHLDTFITLWEKYNINPYVVIAIAKADSSLGNELSTANNIGNVGNNDRWDRVAFETLEKWIEAIYKTLNNKYLWDIYTIGYLSEWGRIAVWSKTSCKDKNQFCYATSEENWNINVINTLRNIYNDSSID